MLNYEINFRQEDIMVNFSKAKQIVTDTINDLVETNWLNGLITTIYYITPALCAENLVITYNINYMVFDDPDYKEEQERMEIGL